MELFKRKCVRIVGYVEQNASAEQFSGILSLSPFLAGVVYATAYWRPTEKTVHVKNVLDKNGDAYGFYNNSMNTTGWGVLEIKAGYGSQALSNEVIMFVAGYLEGYLTAP